MTYSIGSLDKITKTLGICANGIEIERVAISAVADRIRALRWMESMRTRRPLTTVSAYKNNRQGK